MGGSGVKSEANIQQEIRLALSEIGCLVWRNNTGAYKDKTGRLITYGLCKGSSDLIGIAPDARFLAVEVKKEGGRVRSEQLLFIEAVRRAGGIAGICRSADEAVKLVKDAGC